ncbi:hypothetical protein GCM10010320_33750 [Streptomyces caelestis]|nr:hypothetical protein GCM10010320_33750 [Streptomyces caelestis]
MDLQAFSGLRTESQTQLPARRRSASLAPEERRRWLDRTAREGWSRNRLRHELRKEPAAPSDVREHPRQVRLQLRTTAEHETAWTKAAERDGLDLAEWITANLDRAAGLDDAAKP